MKNEEQTLRYVTQCHFSDQDWPLVLDYCRKKYGGGKAHRALSPISDSDYNTFISWIDDEEKPGVGDIVVYGNTTGIIGGYTPECIFLSAYLSYEGQFIANRLYISSQNSPACEDLAFRDGVITAPQISKASEEQIADFKQKMFGCKMRFSIRSSRLTDMYVPENLNFVRVTDSKKKVIVGICNTVDVDRIKLYVEAYGKTVKQNTEYKWDEVVVACATKMDVERFHRALYANRMVWSPLSQELQKTRDNRAEPMGKYWYLTDRLTVCTERDTHQGTHDERYKRGNYFNSLNEAVMMLQKVQELLKANKENV